MRHRQLCRTSAIGYALVSVLRSGMRGDPFTEIGDRKKK
jgi:hypothetical protein